MYIFLSSGFLLLEWLHCILTNMFMHVMIFKMVSHCQVVVNTLFLDGKALAALV